LILVEQVGSGHVFLMGTDYLFPMSDPSPVDTAKAIPDLSQEQRRLILGEKVARLVAGIEH
jgi:hypothetical protein